MYTFCRSDLCFSKIWHAIDLLHFSHNFIIEFLNPRFSCFQSPDEDLEIFFYDEKKGGRGFTTGYYMPKQIAENSLKIVSSRYRTEAQEMQLIEDQDMAGSSLEISSSGARTAGDSTVAAIGALEEPEEVKDVIQNQLQQLEEMKSTLEAMTERLTRLQQSW